jgi:hypothetical protein
MEVKGTALKTTIDFVKDKFPRQYDQWFQTLPENTQLIFKNFSVANWYPMKEGYLVPLDKLVEMFYPNNQKAGAEEIGRYSADIALKTIYKVFLMVASPHYILKRASQVFSTFYMPGDVKISENLDKKVVLQITRFTEITPNLEYRIAGWCLRALELANCSKVKYTIPKSIAKGDNCTEITFTWS